MELPMDLNRLRFQELYYNQQYHQMEGIHSGVPTRTTPTITPVTPATLGDTLDTSLLQYQLDTESRQSEAGFVPPVVHSMNPSLNSAVSASLNNNLCGGSMYLSLVDAKNLQGGSTTITDLPSILSKNQGCLSPPIPPHVLNMGSRGSSSSSSSSSSCSSGRKNNGGRRPNKDNGISPEEEEKRKQRRERNKEAAARCRKRRLDHTNQLIQETEALEAKKQTLEKELEKFKLQAAQLRQTLEEHESTCMIRCTDSPIDIKPMIVNSELGQLMDSADKSMCIDSSRMYSQMDIICSMEETINNTMVPMSANSLRQRPNYLPIVSYPQKSSTNISLETPTQELFDSLFMQSGTGLTPLTSAIASSCSTQLRSSSGIDLTSPDATVKKLVSL